MEAKSSGNTMEFLKSIASTKLQKRIIEVLASTNDQDKALEILIEEIERGDFE